MHREKVRLNSSMPSSSTITISSVEESSLTWASSPTFTTISIIIQLNNEGVALLQKGLIADAMERFRLAISKAINASSSIRSSFPDIEKHTASFVYVSPPPSSYIDNDNTIVSKKLYIYQREEYDEGMDLYNEPMVTPATAVSPVILLATLLYNFAHVNVRLGDDKEALVNCGQALTILDAYIVPEVSLATATEMDTLILAILHNLCRIE